MGEKHPIQEVIYKGWHLIYKNPKCDLTLGSLSFFGGGTSWEEEGWVAVVENKDNTLKWILNVSFSEIFRSLEVKDDTIIAISEEYPNSYQWRIPINKPEKLTFKFTSIL
ncbi:MAG: hypothetical protein JW891_17885 [Candidatus Lokiarchaeota archaeon]|nr:hypothetical protein [Candidatus Lokiarchaeota archaeon]